MGIGEKADALEPFHPDRFASRILGMGDMLTLIEKAKEELTDEDVESLTARMKKGELTLDDFLEQYQRIKRMGPISNLLGMLPGLSQIKNQLKVEEMDEKYFAQVEAVIYSMTQEERKHPEIIDGSRRRRIAMGSGTTAGGRQPPAQAIPGSQENDPDDQHRPRPHDHAVPPVADEPQIPFGGANCYEYACPGSVRRSNQLIASWSPISGPRAKARS